MCYLSEDFKEACSVPGRRSRQYSAGADPASFASARQVYFSASTAASTPPRRERDARRGQRHLDAAERPHQHQLVEIAQVADAERAALELAKSGAERQIESFAGNAPELVGVVPVGHHHGRDDVAVFVGAARRRSRVPTPHGGARRFREPPVPREDVLQPFLAQHASASRRPYSRLVAGVYGKNPFALEASIGSHDQYDLGSRACREAASAFSLIALKLSPGGSIRPFCDPAIVTSMPHSS